MQKKILRYTYSQLIQTMRKKNGVMEHSHAMHNNREPPNYIVLVIRYIKNCYSSSV